MRAALLPAFVLASLLCAWQCWAQDAPPADAPLLSRTEINALIIALVPILLRYVKRASWIPPTVLPVLATVLGMAGKWAADAAQGTDTSLGGILAVGLAAVGAREVVDQAAKASGVRAPGQGPR